MKKAKMFRSLLLLVSVLFCSTSIAFADDAAVNSFRAANGRSALRSDPTMIALARAHAEDMARREKLHHEGFLERGGPSGARAETSHMAAPTARAQYGNGSNLRGIALICFCAMLAATDWRRPFPNQVDDTGRLKLGSRSGGRRAAS
jgi:hypothetical protein